MNEPGSTADVVKKFGNIAADETRYGMWREVAVNCIFMADLAAARELGATVTEDLAYTVGLYTAHSKVIEDKIDKFLEDNGNFVKGCHEPSTSREQDEALEQTFKGVKKFLTPSSIGIRKDPSREDLEFGNYEWTPEKGYDTEAVNLSSSLVRNSEPYINTKGGDDMDLSQVASIGVHWSDYLNVKKEGLYQLD